MFNYQPNNAQLKQLESLLAILSSCKNKDIKVWVFGGYGLDALFGELTRDHADIDLYIHRESKEDFVKVIKQLGYVQTPEKVGTVGKVVYRNLNLSPDFRLELGIVEEGAKLVREMGEGDINDKLLPEKPMGRLRNQPIPTPTLLGFKKIIELNNQLAKKDGSDKYLHRRWQNKILAAIEGKR